MRDYLLAQLVEHGHKGDRDAIESIIKADVVLNSQGLVAWLQRLEKYDG